MSHNRSEQSGFTLLEVVLAFTVLAVGMMALYAPMSRGMILSETNKQIKVALFDAQGIVEQIAGTPFDQIMDPDYPTFNSPAPAFRHRQLIDPKKLFGINPNDSTKANDAHLEDEQVSVTFGASLDVNDLDNDGDRTEVIPLAIEPGSATRHPTFQTTASPSPPGVNLIEQFRPAKTNVDEFRTPEPLYMTIEVSWVGPVKSYDSSGQLIRMVQKLNFVRVR